MQPATDATVLGNFKDAIFVNGAVASTFFKRAGKFMVRTDGPDGALHDFQIRYTFGVAPLQQYLIAMPGGRLQALGIAWDSRPREQGGQRWFHLYPGLKLKAGGPLHWSGIDQNWNFMCADCHSTNLRKHYDSATRTFATTYAEIDVGCEACHGPGSDHLAWAAKRAGGDSYGTTRGLTIALDERRGVVWHVDDASGHVVRDVPRLSEREIQMCARCHSRRSQIHEDYVHGQPLGDDYRVALLDDDRYFPDGQIKDEDYEYGSFIQSRMYHAGVTCSDCHEPHSLKLRAQGNGVCLQCHTSAKYASPRHHFHPAGSSGARCVECHMPTRTYMVVDARRDHSIRIPRPDLTVELGVPNACNECHRDKSAQWAAQQLAARGARTTDGFQQFAEALFAGASGAPDAARALAALLDDRAQPAIARASAAALIVKGRGWFGAGRMRELAGESSALLRRAAASALTDSDTRADPGIPLLFLRDPVRAVRIEAADAMAGTPAAGLSGSAPAALRDATAEYIAAQELNADRPQAHSSLAALFERRKAFAAAESQLETALALDPYFAPAAVNLADLDRELGREADARRVLEAAIRRAPDEASLQHALGLSLIREGNRPEGMNHLAAAARLDPEDARFAYVYAVALEESGERPAALEVLERALKSHPYDCAALALAADLCGKAGEHARAAEYAQRYARLGPACADGR